MLNRALTLCLIAGLSVSPLVPMFSGFLGRPTPSAAAAVTDAPSAYHHCSTTGAYVKAGVPAVLTDDFTIGMREAYVVSHQTVEMNGHNFILNGGVLIIENSTIRGYNSQWQVQRGSCLEITDSYDAVAADSINLGGQPPALRSAPDNSSLLINHSTMFPGIEITGRDVTLRITDSVFEDNVFFNGWLAGWPVEPSETSAYISNSIIPTIALAFSGPHEGAKIAGLRAGHLDRWNLHQNLSVTNLPYDLTLDNVTLIPNPGQEGDLLGGGWGLQFLPGGQSGNLWPNVTVSNSFIGELAFYWGCCVHSASFSNLGLSYPVTQTYFGAIRFVNTTIEGFEDFGCPDCNLTFSNVRGIGVFPTGKSNITFINSWTDDSFQPVGCVCNVVFVGNSSLGRPMGPIHFASLPGYSRFPDASWWQSLVGVSVVRNSTLTISGNFTDRLTGPGHASPGSNVFWSNSTAVRTYPVIVKNSAGRPVSGAQVVLSDGSRTIMKLTTASGGRAEVRIALRDANLTSTLTLTASMNQTSGTEAVGLATDSPVVITLAGTVGVSVIAAYVAAAAVVVAVVLVLRRRGRKGPLV